MKEQAKSILLAVLIMASLTQSFFLTYNMPNFNAVMKRENEYMPVKPLGQEQKVENLIYPNQIILHLGNDKHTMLYPDVPFYNIVLNRLKGRSFEAFQLKSADTIDWKLIRRQYEGIELQFESAIPAKLLEKVIPINDDDSAFMNENIREIWIYAVEDLNQVRVLFVTDNNGRVYESTRADLTVHDVKEQVEFGRGVPAYMRVDDAFYIPVEPYEMVQLVLPYEVFTPEEMQNSLFFDPTLTKIITEANGSVIYTDSKRGLQVNPEHHWVTYSDPSAPAEGRSEASTDALKAISFTNQHGGWNGKYRLSLIEDGTANDPSSSMIQNGQHSRVRFQQYWGSYPIMMNSALKFGYVQVTLQNGMVTTYDRSLIKLGGHAIQRELRNLPAGETLLNKLKQMERYSEITDVQPVYKPVLLDEGMKLTPAWQVTYRDGSTDWVI
ncbi:YycH family regulatory protein [Paenibacillus agilis]|uniref:Regulatory protein YycH domain-containing protein n=1 Tax=Paenibacillus agilis TaxID=3020863 RepID=A0A559IQ77_9BACL|nr:two-component system activity regulator YycH [Paenibacillus agilis]TVX89788.1 hypothetical protein FPZ44_18745 [Paenibacillus agilis]